MNCNATSSVALSASMSGSTTPHGAWQSALDTMQAYWQRHLERTQQARAQVAFAEIDTHTLRDIGAPNWLIAESVSRNDARCLRLIDLYRS